MRRRNSNIIVYCFCGVFIVTLVILTGYLCHSTETFKNSQEKIVNEHVKHITRVDSIFSDMKTVLLSNDSVTIVNAQALLSQLQNDSALLRREILLSQKEMNHLVSLHIDKIDNDYSQIGIWGGLLSIIFLIFGFFAIFKIEETKTEARNVLDEVEKKEEEAMGKVQELQGQATKLSDSINSIRKNGENFIKDKTNEFNKLKKSINDAQTQSEERLKRINELLGDIESKNEQYNRSIETMEKKKVQLETLINTLKEISASSGKGVSDEQ